MNKKRCDTCARFGKFLYGGGDGCFYPEKDEAEDLFKEDIEYHRINGCDEWKPIWWKPVILKKEYPVNQMKPKGEP